MSEGQIELVGGPEDGRVIDVPLEALQFREIYTPQGIDRMRFDQARYPTQDDLVKVAVYRYDGQPAQSGRVRYRFVEIR